MLLITNRPTYDVSVPRIGVAIDIELQLLIGHDDSCPYSPCLNPSRGRRGFVYLISKLPAFSIL